MIQNSRSGDLRFKISRPPESTAGLEILLLVEAVYNTYKGRSGGMVEQKKEKDKQILSL